MDHLFKSSSPDITKIVDPTTGDKKSSGGGGATTSTSAKGEDIINHHKRVDRRSSSMNKTERNGSPESNNDSQKSYQFCRICHEGDGNCSSLVSPTSSTGSSRGAGNREALIAPCRCTGSVAMVHLSCLEHWLTTSSSDKCELCHFVYKTRRLPRTWTEFLTESDNQFNIRNMIADIICFFLLTPLLVVSTYLCSIGAHQYYIRERWEAVGLVTLSFFLLVVYFTWCHVTFKYHLGVWKTWERTHQRVRITFGDGSVSEYRRRIAGAEAELLERRRNRTFIMAVEDGNVGSGGGTSNADTGSEGYEEIMVEELENDHFHSRENLYIVNPNHSYNHRFPIQVHPNRYQFHHHQPVFVLPHRNHHHQQQQQPFQAAVVESNFPIVDSLVIETARRN